MTWFNYIGLIFIIIIMLPNLIYAITKKSDFGAQYKNKVLELFEQAGRFGCIVFMIINPPVLCYGFWFNGAIYAYVATNSVLSALYILGWFIPQTRKTFKYLSLSVLPSAIFIISGIISANYPLILFSVIFAICHITISYKSSRL